MSESKHIDEAALATALGAYVRSAPAHDLPQRLRRLRTFTPAGLRPHHGEILKLLDDETARALITDWLTNGRPPLSKAQVEVLRRACEAGDAWRELLVPVTPAGGGRAGPAPGASGEDKVKRARQEARRARQEGRDIAARERTRAAELASEVQTLRDGLVAYESSLAAARSAVEEAHEKHRRAQRRWERKVAGVTAERDEAKKETAELRRELRALRADARRLEREVAAERARPRQRQTSAARAKAPPARRAPLDVPKGRLEDDPETLAGWLGSDNVHLLVDGYNVTLAEGGFGELDLAAQRDRLVHGLAALARRHKVKATIVFDGAEVTPRPRRPRAGPVTVAYSRPDEIADDHLVALLEGLPPVPVVVATNDQELQRRARRHGATVATSNQLLALLR